MKNTRRKGGVRIIREYTQLTAIQYFIENSTFSLFTQLCIEDAQSASPSSVITAHLPLGDACVLNENRCSKSGISGLILSAKLNPGISSSYRTIRLNYINREVKQILFKIFICDTIQSREAIKTEALIQNDIYDRSFCDNSTLLEPLCPCVIYSHSNPVSDILKQSILSRLSREVGEQNNEDVELIHTLFTHNVGFIAMECMENYKTLYSLRESPKYSFYLLCAIHQLSKLHKIGYMHNDLHFENVLIDENYDYYDSVRGRAIIIDFGLATRRLTNRYSNVRKLIIEEIGEVDKNIEIKIDKLNILHAYTQRRYIDTIELYLKKRIENIIPVLSYRGGHKTMKKTEEYKKNHPRKKSVWNLPSSDEFDEMMLKFHIEKIKLNNPDSTLETDLENMKKILDTDPTYIERLIRAQFNGQIIQDK